jgi:lambda family phage minor tail protein L
MTYIADVQTLEPGAEVVLFELDATRIGGDVARFYNGNPVAGKPVTWQGNEYKPWPLEAADFGMTGDGQQPTPTITVGDIDGSISSLCVFFNDLVGAKLIRHRTLGHYLDAVNFDHGNDGADPIQERLDSYIIQRKASQLPGTQVQFEMASPLDFNGQQLPARQIIQNVCEWLSIGGYRGPYCGYTGAIYFDKNDAPVSDPSLDKCAGRVASCKCRFGANNPLPYGSFPASGLIQA